MLLRVFGHAGFLRALQHALRGRGGFSALAVAPSVIRNARGQFANFSRRGVPSVLLLSGSSIRRSTYVPGPVPFPALTRQENAPFPAAPRQALADSPRARNARIAHGPQH